MVKFVSNFPDLRIIAKPSTKHVVNSEVVRKKGKIVTFSGGTYQTDDEEEIEFLRNYEGTRAKVYELEPEKPKKKKPGPKKKTSK